MNPDKTTDCCNLVKFGRNRFPSIITTQFKFLFLLRFINFVTFVIRLQIKKGKQFLCKRDEKFSYRGRRRSKEYKVICLTPGFLCNSISHGPLFKGQFMSPTEQVPGHVWRRQWSSYMRGFSQYFASTVYTLTTLFLRVSTHTLPLFC